MQERCSSDAAKMLINEAARNQWKEMTLSLACECQRAEDC